MAPVARPTISRKPIFPPTPRHRSRSVLSKFFKLFSVKKLTPSKRRNNYGDDEIARAGTAAVLAVVKCGMRVGRIIRTAILGLILLLVYEQMQQSTNRLRGFNGQQQQYDNQQQQQHQNGEARKLITAAYVESYAMLDAIESCHPSRPFSKCVQAALDSRKLWKPFVQWWFYTLLQRRLELDSEIQMKGSLNVESLALRLCVIDHGDAARTLRNFVCQVDCPTQGDRDCDCHTIIPKQAHSATTAVFLKDPLERFVDSFIELCAATTQAAPNRADTSGSSCPDHVRSILKTNTGADVDIQRRLAFEAFVDMIPSQWTSETVPQSLQCDGMYRDKFDFVGNISNFDEDFKKFTSGYQQLKSTDFDFKSKHASSQVSFGPGSELAQRYYTPRTLRRVLEYSSIDYVRLHLPIPYWVENMLREHNEARIRLYDDPNTWTGWTVKVSQSLYNPVPDTAPLETKMSADPTPTTTTKKGSIESFHTTTASTPAPTEPHELTEKEKRMKVLRAIAGKD